MARKKIINAHTHVFTGNFVPPFLARTIAPWPLSRIKTSWIIGWIKKYYAAKNEKQYPREGTDEEKDRHWQEIHSRHRAERKKVKREFFISSRWYLNIPYRLIRFWLTLVASLFFIEFLSELMPLSESMAEKIALIKEKLAKVYLYYDFHWALKALWIIAVLTFIKSSRKLIILVSKTLFPLVKKLLNKQALALLERYLLMGRFTLYGTQFWVARRALNQLPENSSIVILPMDMEHMGAGKSKVTKEMLKNKDKNLAKGWTEDDFSESYKYQMRELWDAVKKKDGSGPRDAYCPFLFVDPRRVKEEGTSFFDYEVVHNKMQLKPCFVKTYMEDRRFSGFKIYPALGYYVFDEYLLPIWRYASENNIPIMTHCVIGTIYYRGPKKKEWNFHPVFQEKYDKDEYGPMLLPQAKNVDFQFNFTHPMNYLCLLEEKLFCRVLSKVKNQKVKDLFGYSEGKETLDYKLSNLKICLAHFGGEEEWIRYMEQDRENYSQRLMKEPKKAIIFMENSDGDFSDDKLSDLWNKADWFSLICSLLIRYKHMYADLSYIISKPSIYPLLNYTLEKGEDYEDEHNKYLAETSVHEKATNYSGKNKLRSRILFGTDFYVVRNHNSDKDLFVETKAALSEESFDLIARENTHNYLTREFLP